MVPCRQYTIAFIISEDVRKRHNLDKSCWKGHSNTVGGLDGESLGVGIVLQAGVENLFRHSFSVRELIKWS